MVGVNSSWLDRSPTMLWGLSRHQYSRFFLTWNLEDYWLVDMIIGYRLELPVLRVEQVIRYYNFRLSSTSASRLEVSTLPGTSSTSPSSCTASCLSPSSGVSSCAPCRPWPTSSPPPPSWATQVKTENYFQMSSTELMQSMIWLTAGSKWKRKS